MAYNIDARRVAGVVIEANKALQGHQFNHGEVVLGLSELIGRVIVEAVGNKIQADEMKTVVMNHINKTIEIGAQASDKRIITGV